jgi:putative ABC transport system ATP-binding protein
MMDARAPLIETRSLGKIYPDGHVEALTDVNLKVERGEFVAIMGPSGSGKSTLLSLIGALDVPTSGSVLFEGAVLDEIGSLDEFRSKQIGFVFQSFYLLPTLTALENVQIPMFEGPRSREQRIERATTLLTQVGLSHRLHHRPSQLSIGERQRVAIARSLANEPMLLLADEPTGNLDSKTTAEVLALFTKLHDEHRTTLIMITHSEQVASYARRCVRVEDGRIVEDTRIG